MGTNLLLVEDLRKSYGSLEALKGISFGVARGEICGYLGPNGAGKSTTVKIITGLIQKSSGAVKINGIDIDQNPFGVKRSIGYVPESGAVYESLTAWEYLMFVGRLYGLSDADLRFKIEKFMELFGLKAELHERMSSYSKGMRQKVVITSALLHDPDLILFDEPLHGLDANAAFIVKELLRNLAREGKTVLFCSHILEVVERLCDRVVIIDKGRIVADGTVASLRSGNESLEYIFRQLTLGQDMAGVTEEFLKALRKC